MFISTTHLSLRNGIPSNVALYADVVEHLNKEQGLELLDLLEAEEVKQFSLFLVLARTIAKNL